MPTSNRSPLGAPRQELVPSRRIQDHRTSPPPLPPAAQAEAERYLDEESKRPHIRFYPLGPSTAALDGSIGEGGPDWFPDLDGDADPHYAALKNGTYRPLMQMVRYDHTIGGDAIGSGGSRLLRASLPQGWKGEGLEYQNTVVFEAGPGTRFYDHTRDLSRLYQKQTMRYPMQRRFYANPRQHYDNILLSDAHTNSFAGLVVDTKRDYVMPRQVHPVLKLRFPSGDDKADAKRIEEHSYLIDKLEAIDNWYSGMGPDPGPLGMASVPIQDKLKAAYRMSLVFGRGIIVKENWKGVPPVQIFPINKGNKGRKKRTNGEYKPAEEIKGIPNVLKVVHPMYAGLTELDLLTGEVSGVWMSDMQSYVPASEMVYLLNGFQTPQPGSEGYGESSIQRALDHVRLYRRLLAVNFPQYLRTSASGMGVFIVNTTGYSPSDRDRIRTELVNSYKSAQLGVLDIANVDQFKFEDFKVNTDIDALVKMEQSLLGSISTVLDMPHSILMDSNESKATLIGRVLTFLEIKVVNWRAELGRQIAAQYYMPNFRALCENAEGDRALLEEFYVDVRFEEVSLETRQEKVERLLMESQLNPYTDTWIGEQLGDPDYEQHIDQEKLEEQKEQQDMELSIQMQRAKGTNGGKEGGKNPVARGRSKNGKNVSTKDQSAQQRTTLSGR